MDKLNIEEAYNSNDNLANVDLTKPKKYRSNNPTKPTKLEIICETEKHKLINYSFKKPKLNNRLFRKRHLPTDHKPVIKSRFLRRNYNILKRSQNTNNKFNQLPFTDLNLDLNDS